MIALNAQLPNIPEHQLQQLDQFLALLSKWNKIYNLTSITKPEEMVTHHLLDSLSISPYLHGDKLIDVGTGGGLPGIPLAITSPGKNFTLLDSNSKKTRFCQQAVAELGLKNVRVVHSRVADYQLGENFDSIISRAFTSLEEMLGQCQHLLAEDGMFLAMKGKAPKSELAELPKQFHAQVIKLEVPSLEAERCLVCITSGHVFR